VLVVVEKYLEKKFGARLTGLGDRAALAPVMSYSAFETNEA
jgi:hypothetical protein